MWTYNQNTLSHHGVKGMKWGVRRKRYGIGVGGFVPDKPNGQQPNGTEPQMTRRQRKVKAYVDKKIAGNNKTLKMLIAEDPECAKRGYNWIADDLRWSNKKLREIDVSRTSLKEAKRIYKYG